MDPNKPPALSGDTLMNANIFNQQIIKNMKVIPSGSSLNEVKPDELTSIQGAKKAMPDVDGIMDDKVGGRKKKRRTRKKKQSRKRYSRKRHSKKRR